MKEKIFNLKNLIIFLISLIVGLIISLFYLLFYSFSLYYFMNAAFISAAVLIAAALLYLVSLQGLFDVFVVGFSNLREVFKKNGTKRYDGLFEYQEIKKEKRKSNAFSWIPILFSGVIYLIISLILYAIFKL